MLRDVFLLLVSDSAQTFPSFVYLIPAIMLFGITDIAVIFAIMIFAMVPLIRYTIEGLRNVPPEMTESADMSGATRAQKLWKVQFPLALPTMAVGFNQALMFAFFMTMIAAFIGTIDLGQELQRTLAGTDLGKNFVLGINVSLMALTFDMIIIRWAERRKALLGHSARTRAGDRLGRGAAEPVRGLRPNGDQARMMAGMRAAREGSTIHAHRLPALDAELLRMLHALRRCSTSDGYELVRRQPQ